MCNKVKLIELILLRIRSSQFEKSENNEDNIKTVVDSANKRDHVINIEKTGKDDSTGTKTTENLLPKSSLKNPTTPKTPKTPRPSNLDAKLKESDANVKEKIKFSFKSNDSVPKAGGSDTQQPSTSTAPPTASNEKETKTTVAATASNNNGRASSCVIDLKTVWFNFAAPPSVPITRKIDYTRLDWNLLSTASPAITAWMNPSNRFAIKLVAMMKAFHVRRTAIAACLMADGLEVQGIQKHPKVMESDLKYFDFLKCIDPTFFRFVDSIFRQIHTIGKNIARGSKLPIMYSDAKVRSSRNCTKNQ